MGEVVEGGGVCERGEKEKGQVRCNRWGSGYVQWFPTVDLTAGRNDGNMRVVSFLLRES